MVAVEVNVSCPNVEDRSRMFAHSAAMTHEVLAATQCGLPRWTKLSPNVPNLVEIAEGALAGGAAGLTLVNTLLGMALDLGTGQPVLGAGGGGLSGAPVHPVAVRAVWECRRAFPDTPIVGVGGVASGVDAAEFLLAGADAVQVGTATFRDPRAPWKVRRATGALVRPTCDTSAVRERRCERRDTRCNSVRQTVAEGQDDGRRTRADTERQVSRHGWPRRCSAPDRCAPASIRRPSCCAAWGLDRRLRRAARFCAHLRRGVRRHRRGHQAAGRLLRAPRLGRTGRPRGAHRRGARRPAWW